MFQFRQIGFGNLGWRQKALIFVIAAAAIALLMALVVLSFGLAIVLLPVVAVMLAIGRWRLAKSAAQRPGSARDASPVIEIDYKVIDKKH